MALLLLLALNASAGTITESTVNFCIDDGTEVYPEPHKGWTTWAYCRNDKLVMVLESKGSDGKTVYTEKWLTKHNYSKAETGLPCNISVYKCDVERY